MKRLQLWSSGGGVQSSAIAALIVRGDLPKPDLSVIVDTEREASSTWDYMGRFVAPALRDVGVELVRVRKSEFAKVDYLKTGGKYIVIPAFTDESGEIGKLPTYCSDEWKRRVLRRYAESIHPKSQWDVWIGFTIDETRRVFQEAGKWQPRFPLIEKRMTRGDCIALVESMGWDTPPRSSCWMCPNRGLAEFKHLRDTAPADFSKAVAFEQEIRQHDDAIWLTQSGIPLDQAVEIDDGQGDLFDSSRCSSGMCFV